MFFLLFDQVVEIHQPPASYPPIGWTSPFPMFPNALKFGLFAVSRFRPVACTIFGGELTPHDSLEAQWTTNQRRGSMAERSSDFLFGSKSGDGRVLVVDDEADIRKVVRMTLEKANYEVLEAEDGKKAIEVLTSGDNRLLLDVIICDIRMPSINGVEAIAYFQKEYPNVKVIVLTGFPDVEMATSFLRKGVVDYLVKPVEGEKLKAAVAKAMEQREIHRL